jgi:PAS domain S-box-containing protein
VTGTFPESDLERNTLAYVGRWVVAGAGLVVVGYLLSLLTHALTDGIGLRHFMEFAGLFGASIGLVLASRDHARAGGVVVVAVVWLELHVAVFQSGALPSSGTPVLPVLVIATVLFLGPRAGLLLACLTGVLYPMSAWIGATVLDSGPPIANAFILLVLIIALFAATVLGHIGMRSFGQVLRDSLASQRKFSSLVRNAPVGIVVLTADGRVESTNREAVKLLGATDDEMRNQRFSELLARVTLRGSSDLPSFDNTSNYAAELILAPDEHFKVDVELISSSTVLGDGREGTQVVLRDVTEQREVERKAAQMARMYDESLTEAYAFDVETLRLKFVNRAARVNLGYEPDELEALTVTDVNPALGAKRARRLVTELSSMSHSLIQERGKHTRKDGSLYPVELRQQLLSVEGRQTIAVLALDISRQVEADAEQRQLRAQVEKMQKMEATGRLAGAVAHDFNNVLEVIGGYADRIRESSSDQDVRDWAEGIAQARARGNSLTHGLLSCARQGMVRQEALSLSQVMRDLESSVRSLIGERIELFLETTPQENVYVDRAQLENLILNLVNNAADAMPDGGTLRIRVDQTDSPIGPSMVRLEVEDTGGGMDERTRARAFEPFYTTKPIGEGTGLGLSSVHGVVTLSGGTVEIFSELGRGTTVRVEWPFADGEAGEVEADGPPQGDKKRAAPSGTILVVEDDDGTRGLLERVLAGAGYDVHTAGSAEEGLEWFSTGHHLDMLVTDIVMPGRTGFELGEEILTRNPELPVLYMSGYMMSGYLESPAASGGGTVDPDLNFLLKPFSPTDLLDRVEKALRGVH